MSADERLPDGLSPRLLSVDQAAAYCGVSRSHFGRHLAREVRPLLIGTRKLWDIRALDRWLDNRSGISHAAPSRQAMLEALNGDPRERR